MSSTTDATTPRAPSDEPYKEYIYDKKCGQNDNGTFWKWCAREINETSISTTCTGLFGSGDTCPVDFILKTDLPEHQGGNGSFGPFDAVRRCDYGPGKPNSVKDEIRIHPQEYQDIQRFCYQELHGYPPRMPLWLILLIVFLTLLALGTSAVLFWKYWIKPTVDGKSQTAKKGVSLRKRPVSNRASQTPLRRGLS